MKRFIQTLTFLCGPWMILPVGFMVLSYGYKLSNNGIGEARGIQLFLDGSSDWGGTSLFAATLCAYLVFGFLASWHLTLRLASTSLPSRFLSKFIMSIYFLIPHFIFFLAASLLGIGDHDFRNMALWVILLYLFSILMIVRLSYTSMRLRWKLFLAPFFMMLWLVLGSDGNTLVAGQSRNAGDPPKHIIRGWRHGVMVFWNETCNLIFGK